MAFNPDMLKIARESRKLTQKELADKLIISQVLISKIEAGIYNVSEDILSSLSKILDYPTTFFENDCYALDMGIRLHRKRSTLTKKEESYIDSIASINNICISKILNFVDIDINIPEILVDDYKTPEDIAIDIRYLWDIPKGCIKNLTAILEKAGIFISEVDENPRKFDAVSFYNKKYGFGVIIINKNQPADRYRFTLAHELGHLIMHRNTISATKEQEANRFAANLLMPAEEIADDLKNLQFWNLPTLKQIWRVSMAALIVRAHDLALIDDKKYTSLNVRLSQMRYRQNEPTMNIEKEEPSLFKDIVLYFFRELNYSEKELLQLLSINQDDFYNSFYIETRNHIRSNKKLAVVDFTKKNK